METNGKPLSYMQTKAIEVWLRNGRKNKAEALREAGYSMAMVRQPHKVFDSPAVQRELELRGLGKRGVENNKKPVETIQYIIKTPVDLSQIQKDQIRQLKEALEALPGERLRLARMDSQGEGIDPYTPEGTGTDIFSGEAKDLQLRSKLSSFSSM